MKKKILFMCEAVTWSHVVRLLVIARGLDPRRYEIHTSLPRGSTGTCSTGRASGACR